MKRIFILSTLVIGCLMIVSCSKKDIPSGVQYEPQYVIEGAAKQKVVYNPAGTVLENEKKVKGVLYIMRNYWWEATDLDLKKRGGRWTATFEVPEDAVLLCSKFYTEEKADWGWPATYATFVLDKNKQNKEGSRLGWAMLRTPNSGLNLPGMMEAEGAQPIAGEVQLMWLNNEFQQFPQAQLHQLRYLVNTLGRVKPGEKNQQLKENILFFLANDSLSLTDQQWSDMYDIAQRTLSDTTLARQIKERTKALYPDGIMARDEELLRIQNLFGSVKTREPDDSIAALAQVEFEAFLKRFPTEKFRNARSFVSDLFYSKIFRAVNYDRIMRADDYSNVYKYIHDIPFDELVSTHWHVVEIPFTNGQISAEKALPLSELIVNEMLTRPRDEYSMLVYSPNEWEKHVVKIRAMALYAHARVLDALERADEAMKYMEMVYPLYADKAEYANIYVALLQNLGRDEEVIPYIKKCVSTDATTQQMLDLLREDYRKNSGSYEGFEDYLYSLKSAEKIAQEREKAISQLIDIPIELCALENMEGGITELNKKEGKILFLDFWATWCAPCKASMAGGQMLVDRWADDSDVEFYFVDTEENTADYRKKAEEFIHSKGYSLNVLFDEGELKSQNKLYKTMCAALHTSGIPLKVIVDGRGHIRWMGSGYKGSPVGMADEISYIIEYLKNEK